MADAGGWRERLARPALPLVIEGAPSADPTASVFGVVRLMAPEEDWPVHGGRPLWPMCQLNLAAAPWRPPILDGIALLTLFVAHDYYSLDDVVIDASASTFGNRWQLRAYSSLDGLVPAPEPDHGGPIRPSGIVWGKLVPDDYPTHELLPFDFDALGLGDYGEQPGVHTMHDSKLGGWPDTIQSEPWWATPLLHGRLGIPYDEEVAPDLPHGAQATDFEFAFQIASEEGANWMWGDAGTASFARSRVNPALWGIDVQWS